MYLPISGEVTHVDVRKCYYDTNLTILTLHWQSAILFKVIYLLGMGMYLSNILIGMVPCVDGSRHMCICDKICLYLTALDL